MDKKLILASAGSGKTYHIIRQLNDTERFMIVAYTNNNIDSIKKSIIDKFGYHPENIRIKSFFNFLYSFCYKPYLSSKIQAKGISWKLPPAYTRGLTRSNVSFYMTANGWIYHNRLSKLLIENNSIHFIIKRLEKYYDCLLIDEVQDFGGHDFTLLLEIAKSKLNLLFVGDFSQHTFSTSNDGKININLYQDFNKYKIRFINSGFVIDDDTLLNSRRCSKTLCDFVRENIGINIYSHEDRISQIVIIKDQSEADEIFKNNNIIKLFIMEHYNFNCKAENWGSCKGLEFENVSVIISDDLMKLYNSKRLNEMKPITKNKFYVACTRTKNDLYLIPSRFAKKYKKGPAIEAV